MLTGADAYSAHTPRTGRTVASTLPPVLMGVDYPLNQPVLDLPADTRELTSSGSLVPIDIALRREFGHNRLHFDCTMPITVVDSSKTPYVLAPVAMTKDWGSDDASAVPILGANIEIGEDHHALIYDMATGLGHELFSVESDHNITYSAAMYRRWDFAHGEVGAPGKNSADAAGLPIMPLLLRYNEATSGTIHHAIRFTLQHTRGDANGGYFTPPASHAAGNSYDTVAYEGMRLRLRSDFNAAGFSRTNQNIIRAFKTYGLVLADNGGSGYVTADDDPRWNPDDLRKLGNAVTLSDFIAVNTGKIIDSEGQEAK